MGIVKNVLAEFELSSGESIRIEDNEGGMIHIHIDNITVGMTREEFNSYADAVERAHTELTRMKK